MNPMNPKNRFRAALALALALTLALGPAAGAAGLWSWLTGEEAAEASATLALTVDPTPVPDLDERIDFSAAFATETPAPAADAASATDAVPTADAAPDAEPAFAAMTPAPETKVPACALEDDGLLRVRLDSLGEPSQLNLTFDGVYAVEGDPGFRFDRATRVGLSAAEGSVYLSVGGLTLALGRSVTFTRHRAEEGAQNGIRIDESETRALYCGDLTVSAADAGLRAVLTLPVEDYLYGVVAYEMSDSFPLEALKAQAVAARTYAMQRKWQAGARDYDLVDTTADQVFKGYDPEYANVIAAVDATRGVVGLADGAFAVCYYTASNGGQTALPSQVWNTSGGDGYLAMADDPYDLENPRSLQNELTVSPRCEGSAALKAMLEEGLGEVLAEEGYGPGEWEFYDIRAVAPVDPLFEGSRMFRGLEFALRARLLTPAATDAPTAEPSETPESAETPEPAAGSPEPAAQPASDAMPVAPDETLPALTQPPREWAVSERTFPVTLDVYEQIKQGLSLGLNGRDYELVSVETAADEAGEPRSFTIVMRRFGHGVGMSQRGAQWMAGHYGLGWQQILAFYYPGMSVERMDWPEAALTDLEALPAGVGAARPEPTPEPTPAPLPALETGEYYAVVTASALNVRQSPTTAARAVAKLSEGRRVIVCGEADAEGWVPVRTAELSGYVKAEYLKKEE